MVLALGYLGYREQVGDVGGGYLKECSALRGCLIDRIEGHWFLSNNHSREVATEGGAVFLPGHRDVRSGRTAVAVPSVGRFRALPSVTYYG